MTAVGLSAPNARVVALEFTVGSVKVAKRTTVITRHYGQLLTTRVQAKASGRPGPNAPTGDYRRSINMHFVEQDATVTATAIVGTNAPQGRRLEFGFDGVDSLGRAYNQPPYPHFGPAFDDVSPKYVKAMEKMVVIELWAR